MTPPHLGSGPELDPVKGPGSAANGLLDLRFGHEFATADDFAEFRIFLDKVIPLFVAQKSEARDRRSFGDVPLPGNEFRALAQHFGHLFAIAGAAVRPGD